MNTGLPYCWRSLGVIRASFDHRIRDQGVGGSNPLAPTNARLLPVCPSPTQSVGTVAAMSAFGGDCVLRCLSSDAEPIRKTNAGGALSTTVCARLVQVIESFLQE